VVNLLFFMLWTKVGDDILAETTYPFKYHQNFINNIKRIFGTLTYLISFIPQVLCIRSDKNFEIVI
jgi:hypothetical protein